VTGERILITGATGNVGAETLRELIHHSEKSQFEVIAGVRDPAKSRPLLKVQPDQFVKLDFADTRTFASALTGVSRLLLVRPPELADVDNYFKPFIEATKHAGVRQVTFLSLQGVENNPVTPHHKIEKLIVEADLEFTFLRPSFFMQNLCTTHRDEIRLRNELFIPAGNSRTSFVDARDVAAIAALALTSQSSEHFNRGYELTGSEALTYHEIAQILTDSLGHPIVYRKPSVLQFIWQKWRREKLPLNYVLILTSLYTVARTEKAAGLMTETEQLLGRPPITFRQFATDNRSVWMRDQ
jgi:uncharacterized protein YbjT (DUF2867 family)